MQASAPLIPPQAQQNVDAVEKAFQESIALKDAQYRQKIGELVAAIQVEIASGHLIQSYGDNLKALITEPNQNKPVTKADRFLANYVTQAYKAFVDGNESPSYKTALDNVTQKLQNVKQNFDTNSKVSDYNADELKRSLRHAKAQRPLSKNQKALNVGALCGFIFLAVACSIAASAVPGIGLHLTFSLLSTACVIFSIYQGVQMARRQPTIFNPQTKECKLANQAANSMQRMTPAKS